jgi:hypothetical protein
MEEFDQLDEPGNSFDDEADVEFIDEDEALFDEPWKTAVLDPENLWGEKMRFKVSNHWQQGFIEGWKLDPLRSHYMVNDILAL